MMLCLCGGIELVLLAWLGALIAALLSRVPIIGDRLRDWNQGGYGPEPHR